MARGFAGGASTDRINFGSVTPTTARTMAIWLYVTALDATTRRLHDWASGADLGDNFQLTSTNLTCNVGWTSNGGWNVPVPSTAAWFHFIWTYDGSSDTNDPLFYYDNVSQTVTESAAPSGSLKSGAYTYILGNRSGTDRAWNGRMAHFARWNRVITADERAALAAGYSPLFFPNGLIRYVPLGRSSPEIDQVGGTSGTVTGATVVDEPRIIYPTRPTTSLGDVTPPPPATFSMFGDECFVS